MLLSAPDWPASMNVNAANRYHTPHVSPNPTGGNPTA